MSLRPPPQERRLGTSKGSGGCGCSCGCGCCCCCAGCWCTTGAKSQPVCAGERERNRVQVRADICNARTCCCRRRRRRCCCKCADDCPNECVFPCKCVGPLPWRAIFVASLSPAAFALYELSVCAFFASQLRRLVRSCCRPTRASRRLASSFRSIRRLSGVLASCRLANGRLATGELTCAPAVARSNERRTDRTNERTSRRVD